MVVTAVIIPAMGTAMIITTRIVATVTRVPVVAVVLLLAFPIAMIVATIMATVVAPVATVVTAVVTAVVMAVVMALRLLRHAAHYRRRDQCGH
jgi:hypothetical protein